MRLLFLVQGLPSLAAPPPLPYGALSVTAVLRSQGMALSSVDSQSAFITSQVGGSSSSSSAVARPPPPPVPPSEGARVSSPAARRAERDSLLVATGGADISLWGRSDLYVVRTGAAHGKCIFCLLCYKWCTDPWHARAMCRG